MFLLTASLAITLASPSAQNWQKIPAPIAAKKSHIRELHGDTFDDTYFWLREKGTPEVESYLKAENDYAATITQHLKPLEEKLYKEMVGRIKETDLEVPYYDRGYYYYSRTEKGKQYSISCRKKGSLDAKEEVILDRNELAKGQKFLGVGGFSISPNGQFLAYSVDFTGYRVYSLYIKDLRNNTTVNTKIDKVNDIIWAQDNQTLFYVTENSAKRPDKLFRITQKNLAPKLIYEEKVPQFNLYAYDSTDHKELFVVSESAEENEVRTIDLTDPNQPMRIFAKKQDEILNYANLMHGTYYIRTNWKAKEFRIVAAHRSKPSMNDWKTLVPEQKDGTISSMDLFNRHLVYRSRTGPVPTLYVLDLNSNKSRAIKFPETNYSVFAFGNADPSLPFLRVSYSSMITPRTVYDVDLKSDKKTLKKRTTVNGYDPNKYVTELKWIKARDGEKIPISIAYKKSVKPNENSPLYLNGYGAYGSSTSAAFDSEAVSLLDRGFIVANCHIRGGGELGEKWHDSGKMKHKMNTFTDFIDCGKELHKMGYSKPEKSGMSGGSAGGLLMGAVLNLAPELVNVALVYVPFVDVINTMLDESIPLTTQEFLEWGNPKIKEQYGWLKAYSPYDNIGFLNYPHILTRTSYNDSQVPYWEGAKWVARIRDLSQNNRQTLLLTNMNAGHGGSSGRYDSIKETAFDYAYLIDKILNGG